MLQYSGLRDVMLQYSGLHNVMLQDSGLRDVIRQRAVARMGRGVLLDVARGFLGRARAERRRNSTDLVSDFQSNSTDFVPNFQRNSRDFFEHGFLHVPFGANDRTKCSLAGSWTERGPRGGEPELSTGFVQVPLIERPLIEQRAL